MIGAVCNLVGYYFIGFPIGVSLMFPAKMGIVGEDRLSTRYTVQHILIHKWPYESNVSRPTHRSIF